MKFFKILPWALVAILCLLFTLTLLDGPRSNRREPQPIPADNFQQTAGSESQKFNPQVPGSPVRQDSPGFIDRAMDNVSQAARAVGDKFSSFVGGSNEAPGSNPTQPDEKSWVGALGEVAGNFADRARSWSNKLRGVPDESAPLGLPESFPPSYDPSVTAANTDSDRDGLSDRIETVLGTDPYKTDTNGNGIPDRQDARSYESVALEGENVAANSDDMIDKWIARAQEIADTILPFVGKPGEQNPAGVSSGLVSNFDRPTPSDSQPNVMEAGVDSTSSGSGVSSVEPGASEGTPTTIPKLNLRISPELLRTFREGLVRTLAERQQAEQELNDAAGDIDAEAFQKLSKQLALINAALEALRGRLRPQF